MHGKGSAVCVVALSMLLALCVTPSWSGQGGANAQPPRTAAVGPVTVDGLVFPSWSDYFQSTYFRENGKRCGTPALAIPEAPLGGRPPSDCSLELTNPSPPEYAPGEVWEIPVVVHIVMSTAGDGDISDELVASQIEVLNEDYRALQGTPGGPGLDVTVQFHLATTDPDGNPTTGITRTTNDYWFQDAEDPTLGTYFDNLGWNSAAYCNIYTLAPESGVLGYAMFPQYGGAGANWDRMVILWTAFGRPGLGGPPYDQGRTVTHEMGHWLGLHHPFNDSCGPADPPGCYTTNDLICDTNPDEVDHGGCPEGAESCGGLLVPIHNYMEYTDDACMWEFTPEQVRRIRCSMMFYRTDLYTTPTDVHIWTPATTGAALSPSRPNPFSSGTEITFVLPAAGRAALVIQDVAGRTIRTLEEGSFAAGSHLRHWDGRTDTGREAASGMYFARLRTAGPDQTIPMMLIR